MSTPADWPDRLDHYLRNRIRHGDDGKTLLLGVRADRPRFAVAAGLRGEQDHPHFVNFARYLLHQRFACDGYALMLPALIDGAAVYAVQLSLGGASSAWLLDTAGNRREWRGDRPLGDDLGDRGLPLPGLRRRDFDALYSQLVLPLP